MICGSQQELDVRVRLGVLKLDIDDFQFCLMRSDKALQEDKASALSQFDKVPGIACLPIHQGNEIPLNG